MPGTQVSLWAPITECGGDQNLAIVKGFLMFKSQFKFKGIMNLKKSQQNPPVWHCVNSLSLNPFGVHSASCGTIPTDAVGNTSVQIPGYWILLIVVFLL